MHYWPAIRLVLEDKVTWLDITTGMSLDDVVVFTELYEPWHAAMNKAQEGAT